MRKKPFLDLVKAKDCEEDHGLFKYSWVLRFIQPHLDYCNIVCRGEQQASSDLAHLHKPSFWIVIRVTIFPECGHQNQGTPIESPKILFYYDSKNDKWP